MALLDRPIAPPGRRVERTTMRAVVLSRYGSADTLEVSEVAMPIIGDDELLVQVHAAALNPVDLRALTGLPYLGRLRYGLRRPRATGLGADLAGRVAAVGRNVTAFAPGDEVFGVVDRIKPGHRIPALGSCAEFVCVQQDGVVHKPAKVSFRKAASVGVAGTTALRAVRDIGRVRAGQHILVNGACGGVGSFAVQIAKDLDAEVTAVCSPRNIETIRALGADHVLDETVDDFTAGPRRFDVVLDIVGDRSLRDCRRVMHLRSTYVAGFRQPHHRWFGPALKLARMTAIGRFVSQRLVTLPPSQSSADLLYLADLLEQGRLTSVIERTYPLCDIACAMRRLQAGDASGKILITL